MLIYFLETEYIRALAEYRDREAHLISNAMEAVQCDDMHRAYTIAKNGGLSSRICERLHSE